MKMNILIIKNDGLGDLILTLDLIKKIKKDMHNVDIVLSKNNEFLLKNSQNFKKYIFDIYGSNYTHTKRMSKNDKLNLIKLKKKNYDLCIVLRRYLNDEQVLILNQISTKKLILCHQYFSSKVKLNQTYKKIYVPKNLVHDTDYFRFFLKKINLIKSDKIKTKKKQYVDKKYLILNLSGERQFKNIDNLNFLLKIIIKNYKSKIYIIGKTIDDEMNEKISVLLKNFKIKNLINLWSKTNFNMSIKLINKAEHYVGFDTGLSHYACINNKHSLIIMDSGGNHKWFPYPEHLNSNLSYWTYNVPCSGCNFSGQLNKCFFKIRYCVDNIFLNKQKVSLEFSKFLNKDSARFLNFSKYNHFISDWTLVNGEKKILYFLKENGEIIISKKNGYKLYKIITNWLSFIIKNKINFIYKFKILIKNILSFFNYFKIRD